MYLRPPISCDKIDISSSPSTVFGQILHTERHTNRYGMQKGINNIYMTNTLDPPYLEIK